MAKIENVYIRKAKKKRLIKKIFILIILLIVSGIIFVTQTNFFKINNIECTGENLLTKEFVIQETEKLKGTNIFSTSEKKIAKMLSTNPYIKGVNIKRSLPKKLIINVSEKKGLYYINEGNKYNIVSSELVLLEQLDSIENRELIEVKGINISGKSLGEQISDNSRIEGLLEEFYSEQEVIKNNSEDFKIEAIDLSDLTRINVHIGNVVVRLGRDENVRKKMSDAITIYKTGVVKEYIDVSFNGTPDFK